MNDKYSKYETLVRAFHGDIYRYAVWLIKDATIAEDVVQETFMRAWKSLDSLQDEKAAKAWLITILRRENARRFERKQFDYVDDIEDIPLVDDTAINDGEPEQQVLHNAIQSLSDEYREPLILQAMFGYSGEEIANMLELNKNTVMTRLFRARNQLKTLLAVDPLRGQYNG